MDLRLQREDHIILNGDKVPVFVYTLKKGDRVYLPKCKHKVSLKKGRFKKELLRLYCGFDIETTNITDNGHKLAFMYIWQFIVATEEKGYVYLGRTWDDFVYLLETLAKSYNVSRETRVLIWDANFGFEFQFLRKRIDWNTGDFDFFAKELRKPLLATCYEGIEFRDCLAISGGSLAQLAKDFCTTQKAKGDLDYTIPRNSKTALTRQELGYCIDDVKILAEFSCFAFDTWIKPFKRVPLTKTGILRNEVKRALKSSCRDVKMYSTMLQQCYPDKETYYNWFNYLFRGGFVHANYFYSNEELAGVLMYDITSSYPAQMLLREYPVTPFVNDTFSEDQIKTKCCIMTVDFYGLETTTFHSIESKHKLIAFDNIKLDNGRVYKADYIRVMLTELDYENYKLFYRWERLEIVDFKTAKRGYLPPFLTEVLKKHYKKKADLKQRGLNHTPEYALVKSGVNSFFGMTVTRINLDKVTYGGDWVIQPQEINFTEEKERQILLPQWGVYVAAWGRHELLQTVWKIEQAAPNSVVYCDTDSIKCFQNAPDGEIQRVVNEYNKSIAELLKARNLTDTAFYDLGMFDLEYKKPVERFKALGAKRYIYEVDNEFTCTIAGLPKDVLPKVTGDPFNDFDMDGLVIPLELSEKLTTAYNDEATGAWVEGEYMEELSSVALYSIPFSLFTDKEYYNLVIGEKEKEQERKYLNEQYC